MPCRAQRTGKKNHKKCCQSDLPTLLGAELGWKAKPLCDAYLFYVESGSNNRAECYWEQMSSWKPRKDSANSEIRSSPSFAFNLVQENILRFQATTFMLKLTSRAGNNKTNFHHWASSPPALALDRGGLLQNWQWFREGGKFNKTHFNFS